MYIYKLYMYSNAACFYFKNKPTKKQMYKAFLQSEGFSKKQIKKGIDFDEYGEDLSFELVMKHRASYFDVEKVKTED